MTKSTQNNYSTIKTFTLILVVFAHITRMYTGYGAVSMPPNALLTFLTEFIYLFHMPLFMFLSGAVYKSCINAGKYNNFLKFICTKFKRLAIPFVVFGLFYVFPTMVLLKLTPMSPINYIIKGLFLGKDTRHLWFLYSLLQFFLVIQLLKPILQKWKCARYLLFVGSILLYLLSNHVSSWLGMKQFFMYFCFFAAGYIYEDFRSSLHNFFNTFWYLGFILFIGMGLLLYCPPSTLISLLSAFLGIMASFMVIGHFADLLNRLSIFQMLQNTSMGIYLFHPMLIYIIFYFIRDLNLNPYIVTVVLFAIVMLLSYYFTKLVRLLHLQTILGE